MATASPWRACPILWFRQGVTMTGEEALARVRGKTLSSQLVLPICAGAGFPPKRKDRSRCEGRQSQNRVGIGPSSLISPRERTDVQFQESSRTGHGERRRFSRKAASGGGKRPELEGGEDRGRRGQRLGSVKLFSSVRLSSGLESTRKSEIRIFQEPDLQG